MDCDSSANVVTVDNHSTGFAPRVGRKEGQSQASLWQWSCSRGAALPLVQYTFIGGRDVTILSALLVL